MKERKKPHVLLAYEALFRRLKRKHWSNRIINSDYQSFNAGFRGEKSVDYKLRVLPHKEYLLYYGLRLQGQSGCFQMDTLVVTESFICIVEIKNMKEKLVYDSELEQFIQITDGKEIGYKDPILQVETQKEKLKIWLQNQGIHKVPIETFVVSANPSTIITNIQDNPEFYNKFIHSESLPFQLNKLKMKHTLKLLDRRILKKLNTLLLQLNQPQRSNLLDKYGVFDHHLIKGIPCSNCYNYPMDYLGRTWTCSKCLYSDCTAHERVILDYFLLYQCEISNGECRKLLQINSRRIVYRFLKSMNIKEEGNTSGRKYYLPDLDSFPQNSSIPIRKKSILE